MYFSKTSVISLGLLASSTLVAGHCAITAATGDAGGQGSAIGVNPATPRDGTGRNPFQQDSTRFRGDAAATCGETLGGGNNDVEAGTAQVMAQNGATLPQITPGGQIMMTVHQVNADGAGQFQCMIDSTGTGTNWQPVTVTQNLPGNERSRNRDTQMMDLPLTASIPAGQTCSGTVAGQSNICMVRCENSARAGPFGGCVPVQMAAGTAAAAPAANANGNGANTNGNGGNANGNGANTNGNGGNTNGNGGNTNGNGGNTNGNGGNANGNGSNANGNGSNANGNGGNANGNGGNANGNGGNANGNGGNANAATPLANTNANIGSQAAQQATPQQATQPQAAAPFPNGNTGSVAQDLPVNTGATTGGSTVNSNSGTVSNTAPIAGAGARKREATRNQPALTNDDQEEELDLLDGEF